MAYKIMIMGASYGSLLASKILFGGHSLHLVCLPAEADLINAEGFRVRMPVKGRKDQIEIDSRKFDCDPVLLYRVLEYYANNPQARTELGSAAATERVHRHDLDDPA